MAPGLSSELSKKLILIGKPFMYFSTTRAEENELCLAMHR